ncbi:hypothetical protein B484DRAFT_446777 [Ochromonadaceae sp. CCMP2298]|nr:hypothetical protein B484DRAFT_446777 [Ochromonadaceae sp. CCMP2298]|mmetsp:Transcript_10802/g.23923  ORF Transcript_10802/g.23923 Transcript_10802/m.23923 type:complete len:229 (+) Transcript_10802:64-750(+)|eukprot:CAMPEP_0173311144 /NCGR_PEP_ID=MMETSP1143-20121109/23347_1 /TAXON_ID=483371 /ORGANISM="non described non described, Strain CCMP2298" /LENGTH=228 /DNA_ID=CAMNT_0014253063 /DNA_START=19 /DNA_END=705 /DNA_ORIENTATION=+
MRQSVQRPKNKKKDKEDVPATSSKEATSFELVVKLTVPDDASVASVDSFGLSDAGSQLQLSVLSGSLVGSQVTGSVAKDSDSDISVLHKPPGSQPAKEAVALYTHKMAIPTTLVFISLDGVLTDFHLDKRLDSYTELQREIAKLTKKSRQMFAIQDDAGLPIKSDSFKGYNLIRVKEIAVRARFQDLRLLSADWESTGYHEARHKKAMEPDDGDVSYLSQGSGDYGKM